MCDLLAAASGEDAGANGGAPCVIAGSLECPGLECASDILSDEITTVGSVAGSVM